MIWLLQVDNWLHQSFEWSHLHHVKRKPPSQCVDQGCLSMTLRAFNSWKYSEAEWVFPKCYQARWPRQKSIHRYSEWTSNLLEKSWTCINFQYQESLFCWHGRMKQWHCKSRAFVNNGRKMVRSLCSLYITKVRFCYHTTLWLTQCTLQAEKDFKSVISPEKFDIQNSSFTVKSPERSNLILHGWPWGEPSNDCEMLG